MISAVKKQAEQLEKANLSLDKPLVRSAKARVQRQVVYEEESREVSKWVSLLAFEQFTLLPCLSPLTCLCELTYVVCFPFRARCRCPR